MSSFRKAGQRRSQYQERAQPTERARFGLLEKHKDYSLRAQDHNKKKRTLKSLKSKASERNEDEFYFGMLNRSGPGSNLSRGKRAFTGTVDGDRGNRALDVDVVRLLKTQDQGYLRTMRNVAAREVRELEERAAVAGAFAGEGEEEEEEGEDDDDGFDFDAPLKARKPPKKIVFVDDAEEMEKIIAGPGPDVPVADDDDMRDDEVVVDESEDKKNQSDRRDLQRLKAARLRTRLANAKKRLRVLTRAENELELQRARMAKSSTVGGTARSGRKFKVRERKR